METLSFPNTYESLISPEVMKSPEKKNRDSKRDDDLMVFPVFKSDWVWLNNFSIARLKQAKANSF